MSTPLKDIRMANPQLRLVAQSAQTPESESQRDHSPFSKFIEALNGLNRGGGGGVIAFPGFQDGQPDNELGRMDMSMSADAMRDSGLVYWLIEGVVRGRVANYCLRLVDNALSADMGVSVLYWRCPQMSTEACGYFPYVRITGPDHHMYLFMNHGDLTTFLDGRYRDNAFFRLARLLRSPEIIRVTGGLQEVEPWLFACVSSLGIYNRGSAIGQMLLKVLRKIRAVDPLGAVEEFVVTPSALR